MDQAQIFYENLISVLYPTCPYRTGNMLNHIKLEIEPDRYIVTIEAPTGKGYDYARAVNEGLRVGGDTSLMSEKELRNYHWVQRAIEQASLLTAQVVIHEGGYDVSLS